MMCGRDEHNYSQQSLIKHGGRSCTDMSARGGKSSMKAGYSYPPARCYTLSGSNAAKGRNL